MQGMLTMLFWIRSSNNINGDIKHILFVTTVFHAAALIKIFASDLWLHLDRYRGTNISKEVTPLANTLKMEISSFIITSISIVYNNPQCVQTQNKNLHNILFWVPQVPNYMSGFKVYFCIPNFRGSRDPWMQSFPKNENVLKFINLDILNWCPCPFPHSLSQNAFIAWTIERYCSPCFYVKGKFVIRISGLATHVWTVVDYQVLLSRRKVCVL
jgi:hypothetical protein